MHKFEMGFPDVSQMRQLISQLDGVSAPSEITVLDLPTRTTQIKFTLRGEWALGASYALQDKVSLYFCLVICSHALSSSLRTSAEQYS